MATYRGWNPVSRPPTHGMYGTPTYRSWRAMKSRCLCPSNIGFKKYGGAGIKVCKRWMKFENFFADMGYRPKGKTIDRFPNRKGNYRPGNCRWATPLEQQENGGQRKFIPLNGCLLTLHGLARKAGLDATSIKKRLKLGAQDKDLLQPKFFYKKGKHHPKCVLSEDVANMILLDASLFQSPRKMQNYGRNEFLSKKHGVSLTTIKRVLSGEAWTSK